MSPSLRRQSPNRSDRTFAATLLAIALLQVPGFAELSAPQPGQVVSGLVTLRGTADHPAFDYFEVSFAYADDRTATWFPIGEPVETRVIDGRLALWDTAGITDGEYLVRLQVWLGDGRVLEALVPGVQIRNYTSGPTPLPTSGEPPAASALTPAASTLTPTPTVLVAPAIDAEGRPSDSPNWFRTGVVLGGAALLGLAVYSRAGPAARLYLARLRIRRLHQRLDRARSGGQRR